MKKFVFGDESTLIMAEIIDDLPCVIVCATPDWAEHEAQLNTKLMHEHVLVHGTALQFANLEGLKNLMAHIKVACDEHVANVTLAEAPDAEAPDAD